MTTAKSLCCHPKRIGGTINNRTGFGTFDFTASNPATRTQP
jgi:hypothetical protein